MDTLEEPEISKTILCTYHEKLLDRIISDVLIVGAGPSGMTAAIHLAREGLKVTLLEKRLSPGGGIWGGGMGMSQAIVQEDVLPLLDDIGVKYELRRKDLYATDAMELAAALCLKAIQAGAALFNLMTVEDVCLRNQRVTGVVVKTGKPASWRCCFGHGLGRRGTIKTLRSRKLSFAMRENAEIDPGDPHCPYPSSQCRFREWCPVREAMRSKRRETRE